MTSQEFFDICDEYGVPTGDTVEREVAHSDGILHRTAHVWITRIKDGRRQILLQKRSLNKDSFPGMYDTSSAGHIPAGDEPLESAIRELKEELGINADPEQLLFAGNFRVHFALPFHEKLFRDDEIVFVYVYDGDFEAEELTLQAEEVDEVRWFDLVKVYEACQNGIRDRFCVPTEGLKVLINYLAKKDQDPAID